MLDSYGAGDWWCRWRFEGTKDMGDLVNGGPDIQVEDIVESRQPL